MLVSRWFWYHSCACLLTTIVNYVLNATASRPFTKKSFIIAALLKVRFCRHAVLLSLKGPIPYIRDPSVVIALPADVLAPTVLGHQQA